MAVVFAQNESTLFTLSDVAHVGIYHDAHGYFTILTCVPFRRKESPGLFHANFSIRPPESLDFKRMPARFIAMKDIDRVPDDAVPDDVNADMPESEQSASPSSKRLVEQQIDAASPGAATSIIQIALHSESEKLRLEASKYIVDRKLGPMRKTSADTMEEEWAEIYKELGNAGGNK